MNSPGVVLAETDYLREAILAAEPTDYIAQVCCGAIDTEDDPVFRHETGGYYGSALLNISTAVLAHRRLKVDEPPTAKPVELNGRNPKSTIGRMLIDFLQERKDEAANSGALSIRRFSPMRSAHYCNQAEGLFKKSLARTYPEVFVIDALHKSHSYIKGHGAGTLLTQRTTFINDVKIRPGVICAVDYDESKLVRTNKPSTLVLPMTALQQVAALRVSIFPIPSAQRRETFLRPDAELPPNTADWSPYDIFLEDCEQMLNFSREVGKRLMALEFDSSELDFDESFAVAA